uniref:Phytochromobilin:ferredoxin oxidoreductase, chloroplastic n=1 Tax=Ananas comosus var. bracteatus TaxID=296719 RepID=A0A6V7PCE3_ANACO|nr:unnamed protein product [Ananas comosus var. bracteatus]
MDLSGLSFKNSSTSLSTTPNSAPPSPLISPPRSSNPSRPKTATRPFSPRFHSRPPKLDSSAVWRSQMIMRCGFSTLVVYLAVCRDLNPLYDVTVQRDYKEKYFKKLMPLGQKYAELFPWGGKITSESMKFFSPIVIWTTFSTSRDKHDDLYSAFVDYYKAWLELMDEAVEEKDVPQILHNCEAQHKYLTWRAEKDPGYPLLKKLVGESLAKDLVRNFLFEGVDTLGTNTFLDYFPEYRCEDGGVNQKRSMIGKSYETRPWDAKGEFTGG